eukprot:1068519-Amphidinium_carterae.1
MPQLSREVHLPKLRERQYLSSCQGIQGGSLHTDVAVVQLEEIQCSTDEVGLRLVLCAYCGSSLSKHGS